MAQSKGNLNVLKRRELASCLLSSISLFLLPEKEGERSFHF